MKPIDIINSARPILLDVQMGAVAPRQSDEELLNYVNQGIAEVATLLPMMFSTVGDITCQAGTVEQSATFLDAVIVLDVLCIHEGNAITRTDRETLDQFRPGWRTDPAGEAENWMPLEGDPLKFYIYPKAPANQVIDLRYVRNPAKVQLDEEILELPAAMLPAMVDYVIYRAESKDDEHVLNQRAAAHYTAFLTKIGAKNGATAA